jgi:hypothetical protein
VNPDILPAIWNNSHNLCQFNSKRFGSKVSHEPVSRLGKMSAVEELNLVRLITEFHRIALLPPIPRIGW